MYGRYLNNLTTKPAESCDKSHGPFRHAAGILMLKSCVILQLLLAVTRRLRRVACYGHNKDCCYKWKLFKD